MKFSIITPEHDRNNIQFLQELYGSIVEQTYTNWEWVLYLNNNCKIEDLPLSFTLHPQVRIHVAEDDNKNLGHIKNKAFSLGTGDVLVEADHDDILTPDCLDKLYSAYQDPEVGFVYSDNAVLHMTGEFIPYNPEF